MKDDLLVTYSATSGKNGKAYLYVEREDGRKVAAVWGSEAEKADYAHAFATAPAMLDYLRRLPSNPTLAALIARAEGRTS